MWELPEARKKEIEGEAMTSLRRYEALEKEKNDLRGNILEAIGELAGIEQADLSHAEKKIKSILVEALTLSVQGKP